MLKKIKSFYFTQTIFSFVEERNKLKVLKYNKYLQKGMNISLINYIFYSGRYIIYGSNGKGKEYDGCSGILKFEGEYLNGEKNGKCKEYDDGELIFEGEYLNGKKNGKGKEYIHHGRIIFEGEYLNGKKNGKGKDYYCDGKLCFEGYYRDNRQSEGKVYDEEGNILCELKNINGKGKEFDYGRLIFEGEYVNGKRNGKGKKYNYHGRLIFEGVYLNGKKNGKGKEYDSFSGILKFEGEYLNGKKWQGKVFDKFNNIAFELKGGKGLIKEYSDYDILIFEGVYVNGVRNGKGKKYNHLKLIFEGEYLNGKKNGKGKEYDYYGKLIFEGEYLYGYKLKGKEYINKKLAYEGEYLYNRKWNGKGYDKDGNIIYELKNGCGRVKEYDDDGILVFEGEYLNGKRWNGKGKENYIFSETLRFECEYLNGEKRAIK